MNRFITPLLFLIALLSHSFAHGALTEIQDCQGDFTLSSQAEVDAFTCTEVDGNLTISGSNITDLSSLSTLRKVSGKLTFENNPILETLGGLNALESVDIGLYIKNNEALTDFSALSSLKVVGDLTIDNSKMRNFDTFSSLTEITGLLLIANNGLLFEIFGPPSLTIMRGGMSISGNGNLHAVRDFDYVTTIVGGIDIYENANLIDIYGFSFLTTIRTDGGGYGHITIRKNDALSNIQGFPSLTEVGEINFESNGKLSAINVFRSLPRISGHLNLSNNTSLKFITGFNKLTEITGSNVNTIVGLTIVGSSIENLDWLASLKTISVSSTGGGLPPADTRRLLEIKDNALLNDINGLAGLEEQVINSEPLYITITKNPILTLCGALGRYFKSLGDDTVVSYSENGVINISENGSGCTVEEILKSDQVGPPCTGDFVLSSQAEVDAFFCGELTGNLTISGTDITNLNSLALLKKINGNLEIMDNPILETLDLPALEINRGSISILNNGSLNSISGFNKTLYTGSIRIGNNPKLGSISGFDSLVQVDISLGGAEFGIAQNNVLTNIQGFGALKTTPDFRIVNNAKLLALDGFPSLTHVIGEFQISNNESLKTINGFNKLMSISGLPRMVLNSALLIENNASLETLEGLSSLKFISAPLDGGRIPPVPGTVTVYVTGNPKLTQCCSLRPLLDALVSGGAPSPFVRINISGNGGGCTQDDILNCEKICDGDVTLTSQAEVDAFNCTKVTGNLTVTGADITRLFGLSSLREVYGHLRIENVNATSLDGLSLLDSIGGALLVMNNPSLNVILGLSCSVQEGIEISNNNNLLQISGFNTLKKLGWLGVQNNPKLTSLTGFNSVEIIQTSFPDPFAPTGIGISNNGALGVIPGFQMLSKVGSIRINGNDQLSSLDGFLNVSQMAGVLTISDNSSLKVINAFENLVSIVGISRHIPTGGLLIENNPLLEGFPGLSSLKEVKSDQRAEVSISNNASLKNVDGLSSITTFLALHDDKTLNIRNNAALENLDGLSSIVNLPQGEGDTYINVTGNPKLTRCCGLKPLLDAISYYDPLSLHIDISQNGGGCTLQDIMACGPQRVSGFTLLNHQTHAVIQNFQDEITIDLADPRFSHLMLQANTAPQQVGSVEFIFDGHIRHTENRFPYEFILPVLKPGTHTVRTEVFSKAYKQGVMGIGRTATIIVTNSAAVISFDVVETSGKFIKTLQDGDEINIEDPAFKSFSIRANTIPGQVSSVKFWLNHRFFRTENVAPYALNGDINGSYTPWGARQGDYTLVAVPYIKVDGKEYEGKPLKVHFTVIKESAAVVSFDVVDASGKHLMRLQDGDKININDPMFKAINIVANTSGPVGSVSFWLNHDYVRTENVVPYTLAGDLNGYFNTWQPRIGHYKLSATPYGGQQAQGPVGKTLWIHFKVVNEQNQLARFADESIPEQELTVSVYPVPVDNELHVAIDDLSGRNALVTIRNVHGLVVYQGFYSESQEINTSQLRAGVYFLQVTGQGNFWKIVKFMKE